LTVLTPLAVAGRYAQVGDDTIGTVFASADSKSVTRPKNVTREDPWGGRDRVNILLLGGDGGKGRIGIRPDSIQLASIDTRTGNTVLLGLPRNLEKVPFPEDSPLAEVYPDGVFDGPGDRLEWMLNAIYKDVPEQHPGLLDSDNPGADATKLAVGEVLGLEVHYYVLINLDGFKELINALGGITVNVNTRVAIGGSQDEGRPPHDWIEPGPNQHLDGYHALWFARGRYGSSDYERMERQRCAIKAIIDQAQPQKVLTRYEAIAKSSQELVYTDIPRELLSAFVNLSLKVKNAKVTSIAFTNEIIKPWDPDYDKIRSMVRKAIRASERDGRGSSDKTAKPKPSKSASSDPTDPTEDSGSSDEPGSSRDSGSSKDGSTSEDSEQGATSLEDACAYRPQAAG
jgi:LCP family protein required for cell wall assembly